MHLSSLLLLLFIRLRGLCWPKYLQSFFVIINYWWLSSMWFPSQLHHCFTGSLILPPHSLLHHEVRHTPPGSVYLLLFSGTKWRISQQLCETFTVQSSSSLSASLWDLEVCRGLTYQWSVLEKNLHSCSFSPEMNVKLAAVSWRHTDVLKVRHCSY